MSNTLWQTDDDLSEVNLGEFAGFIPDYFERGAGVTADFPNSEVTIEAGRAYIETSSEQVYQIQPDAATLALPNGSGENYVYARFDPGTDDSDTYVVSDTEGGPADPKLLRAVVDTSANTVRVKNDADPNAFQTTAVSSDTTTDGPGVYLVDTSGSTVTLTLASADAQAEALIGVINITGDNDVTVDTEGSETIDPNGDSSKTQSTEGFAVWYAGDGTNWDASLDADYRALTGSLAGGGTITDLTGDGLEINSNVLRAAISSGLEFASGSIQLLSTIWDGTDIVANVNNTTTDADTIAFRNADETPNSVDPATGTVSLDVGANNWHDPIAATENITVEFTNVPSGGNSLLLRFTDGDGSGPYTITLPASVVWDGGTAHTEIPQNGDLEISLRSPDGGATWRASRSGEDFA